jgi:hypothetical protein
MNMKWKVRKDN